MIDWITSVFDEFRRNFRIADAIDILFISVLLYSVLVWFKDTASRGILVGVTVLTAIYFAARALDMFLTTLIFHAGFAVLFVVLVILFQEDLRRFFERIANMGSLTRLRAARKYEDEIDMLVEAVFYLSSHRTGALIVLRGREPLERHLDSGIVLGGRISKPLLYSIFDASSPGHDGAVVIDRDRIEQFAAHLPISKNRKEIAGRGTRHSAALGLSESSDALVIVASEERGTVSVAQGGKMKESPTAADLKLRVERFYELCFPTKTDVIWKRFITQHAQLKLVAIALACVAWVVMAYQPATIQRTFGVPIEYRNLSEDLVLEEFAPSEARVTLSGSERTFRFFDPASIKISIDMSSAKAGRFERSVTEKNLRLPQNLDVYRIDPRVITVYLINSAKAPDSS